MISSLVPEMDMSSSVPSSLSLASSSIPPSMNWRLKYYIEERTEEKKIKSIVFSPNINILDLLLLLITYTINEYSGYG